ncbi:MAG: two-component sensor histidine kinase [Bacillales bacterium]|jgi:signal transduction histidine kinase|nr:two-component sensor histidine kinase [Bacillales bacterium]
MNGDKNWMNKLLDKTTVFFMCSAIYILNHQSRNMIIPLLIAITISSTMSYFENRKFTRLISIGIFFACLFNPSFLFFLPLLCYDALPTKIDFTWIFVLILFVVHSNQISHLPIFLIFIFLIVSLLLKYRTNAMENLKDQFIHLRDDAQANFLQIELKNKELLEKQDYELNLATLSERNRIARDIHDNVGHLLSRSLLQVGALYATSKDETSKSNLENIRETLSNAMDTIRNSVHDLHEQSLEVHAEIQKLIGQFPFCKIHLDYDVQSVLENKMKYCFIAVAKEALVNIMKHSNATVANIVIREHPAFFQMVIHDNGTLKSNKDEQGIGLKNIHDRVFALKGNIHISDEKGFRIFITINKKR